MRLAKALGIDFPFSDYEKIQDLPVIEVEFAHLRGLVQAKGQLTLLDTPGPNESDQPHLRKILTAQLSTASAVLAVLDFTQLNSDADAQVRQNLSEIASVTEGRLYALVNKFDQKDRNSSSADEVKTIVANTLMDGRIQKDSVFTVSAKRAYLANRARHELSINGKLPAPTDQAWVADFGEVAFGTSWKRRISDIKEVEDSVADLWDASLFDAPLESVIRTAHARAAALAIDSAAAKLVDMAVKMENFLNIRETALTKSAEELRMQINAVQTDIERVKDCQSNAEKQANTILIRFKEDTGKIFEEAKSKVSSGLESYFEEGRVIEKKQREALLGQLNENYNQLITELKKIEIYESTHDKHKFAKHKYEIQKKLKITLDLIKKYDREYEYKAEPENNFNLNDSVIKLNKDDTDEFKQKINSSIENIFEYTVTSILLRIESMLESFSRKFSKSVVDEASKIVDEMNKRFEYDKFSINLELPSVSNFRFIFGFSVNRIVDNLIIEKDDSIPRWRRQRNLWGKICRMFDTDDWGWERYKESVKSYEIGIKEIKEEMIQSLDEEFNRLNESIEIDIKSPLDDAIENFFEEFKQTVEQIRGDLLQGIRDKKSRQDEQQELMNRLGALKQDLPDVLADSRDLKKDVQPHLAIDSLS